MPVCHSQRPQKAANRPKPTDPWGISMAASKLATTASPALGALQFPKHQAVNPAVQFN
jgi:hypothetical protein